MSDKRRPQDSQSESAPLFRETSDGSHEPPTIVLSTHFAIGPLLSRGCLLSVDDLASSTIDTKNGPRFHTSNGSMMSEPIDAAVASARNVIPICIQLAPGRSVRQTPVKGTTFSVEAVCLSDVRALLFRNEKEKARFSSIEFGNYSLEGLGLSLKAEPSVFPQPGSETRLVTDATSIEVGVEQPPVSTVEGADKTTSNVRSVIREAECVSGFVAYLFTASPGRKQWMRGVEALASRKAVWKDQASWPEKLTTAILNQASTDAEGALAGSVVDVLRGYPVEDGWPSARVLSEIATRALERMASGTEKDVRDMKLWSDRAADVLGAKVEPQSMSDEAFALQRAVLLLLLRGDVEAIGAGVTAASGRQKPGPQVFGIAGSLAALRTGLRSLPSRCKIGSDQQAPGRLLAYLGDLFLALLKHGLNPAFWPTDVPRPTVTYRSIRPLQGEWVITVAGEEISRIPAEFDTGLERLLTMGRDLGYEFEERGDTGLATYVPQADGDRRPVYLRVVKTGSADDAVVRFSSPTLRLVGVNSRARLPRELLLKLLMHNSRPDMNCRFAIEDEEGIIVVLVDQLLGTLDDAEFNRHVHHVAQVAHDFQLSRDTSHGPGTVS